MSTLILAIDLGTTTTVVCGDIQGASNPTFLCDDRLTLIPSVIYKRDDGASFYGKEAEEEASRPKAKGNLIENFKMLLLDKARRKEGEEYIKEFLREHIHNNLFLKQRFNFPPYDNLIVRISHPSKWDKDLVDFMISAVDYAGFQYSKIEAIAEPLAISAYSIQSRIKALADVVHKNTSYYNTMAIDMGGGTCDVVICKTEIDDESICHVTSSVTYPPVIFSGSCGGRDIDEVLMHYIWDKCHLKDNLRNIFNQHNARIWKEQVSKDLKKNRVADVPSRVHEILSIYDIDVSEQGAIDRSTFAKITSKHWDTFQTIIREAVSDYKLKYNIGEDDIDFIFVTGGHSQWYCVKDMILGSCNFKKIAGNDKRYIDGSECNPNETVARGLCCHDMKLQIPVFSQWELVAVLTMDGVNIGREHVFLGYPRKALPFSIDTWVSWETPKKKYLQKNINLKMDLYMYKLKCFTGGDKETLKFINSFNTNLSIGSDMFSMFFDSNKPLLKITSNMNVTVNLDNSFVIRDVCWKCEKEYPQEGGSYEPSGPFLDYP